MESQRQDLAWKGVKHLLPFAALALALLYWAAAFAEEARDLRIEAFYERADKRLRAQSAGRLTSSVQGPAGVEDLRRRFGVDGNDLPSFEDDPGSLTVTLCPERLSSGACDGTEIRFGVAYVIHVERSGGFDTWQVVMAPERKGRFTTDPLRIVYMVNTAGSKVAMVTAEPVVDPPSWEDDSVVAQLNSFDGSLLGERLEELADESGVERLNRIGLRRDEWRLESTPGVADYPFRAEIYAMTNDEGARVARWLTGEGDIETALGRILLVSGVLALGAAIARLLFRFLAYTARGIPPLITLVRERLER